MIDWTGTFKKDYFGNEKGVDMGSQTSLKTSQRGGGIANPLYPPPGSTSDH